MNTEIIVIKYKNPTVEKACVESILKNTTNYSLTLHDNYPDNINIGQLWNKLIRRSWADYICLLNSDTLVTQYWLPRLLEVFELKEDCGVVSSVTNHSLNPQEQKRSTKNKDIVCYTDVYGDHATLCGFCLLFPKTTWEKIGGFPEDFGFYGQEDVFLAKATKLGLKQYLRKDVFIYHEGSSSARLAEKRGEMNLKQEMAIAREHRDKCFEDMRRGK